MSKLAVANIIFETTEANRIEYTGNNVVRVRANGGLQIPFGTTAQRASPEYGIIRYNTDTGTVEMYDAGGWYNMPTGGYVNTIYTAANSAYALANNVSPQIAPAFDTANAAYNAANNVGPQIAPAFNTANAAFASANNVAPQVTPAFQTANNAFLNSNAAFNTANAAFASANNVAPQVTPAFNTANLAYTTSNGAYGVANAAFAAANTKFSSSGGTITGAVEINASLTVHGNTTFVDQTTLSVGDPLIYLAANNYVSDVVDIGFIANYVNATSSNVHTGLFRSSGTKEYYLFQGYDQEPYNNYIDPTGNNITMAVLNTTVRTSNLILGGANALGTIGASFNTANAAYGAANNVGPQIAPAFNTANAAYNAANNVNLGPAFNVANLAYGVANTALQNTNNVVFNGNLRASYTISTPGFYENDANITMNLTISTGRNAFSAGPIAIANGIYVTIPSGSYWSVT